MDTLSPSEERDNKDALHYMQEIRAFSSSWSVIYLKISILTISYQEQSIIQDLKSFLEKQAQGHMARVFILSNHDSVMFVQNMGPIKIERIISNIGHCFSHNHLLKNALEREDFHQNFSLAPKFEWLFGKIQKLSPKHFTENLNDSIPTESVSMLPFDLMLKLQNNLRQSDLSNFIRKQHICWVENQDTPVRPLGCEYYVSMGSLEDALQSKSQLITDFALFKYLSILFDKKMLNALTVMVKRLDPRQQFHVNLNLRTVVSKEFFEFHQTIQRECVIEIDRTDLLWDLEGFYFATDFLKSHGHKVCVDLLFGSNIALFKNLSLECDYYKIVAGRDMMENYTSDVVEFIQYVGPERIIFVRCDTLESITFGQSYGVKQFQGFLIDKALRHTTTPLNHISLE